MCTSGLSECYLSFALYWLRLTLRHVNRSLSSVERWCLFKDFNQKFPPSIPKSTAADHIWSPLKITASVSQSPLCTPMNGAMLYLLIPAILANYTPMLNAVSDGYYWSHHELFISGQLFFCCRIYTLSCTMTCVFMTVWDHKPPQNIQKTFVIDINLQ